MNEEQLKELLIRIQNEGDVHSNSIATEALSLLGVKKTKQIDELIKVDLHDIIGLTYDSFNDSIAEDAGFPNMENISFEVEGNEGNVLLLRVRGTIDEDNPDWEDDEKHEYNPNCACTKCDEEYHQILEEKWNRN